MRPKKIFWHAFVHISAPFFLIYDSSESIVAYYCTLQLTPYHIILLEPPDTQDDFRTTKFRFSIIFFLPGVIVRYSFLILSRYSLLSLNQFLSNKKSSSHFGVPQFQLIRRHSIILFLNHSHRVQSYRIFLLRHFRWFRKFVLPLTRIYIE